MNNELFNKNKYTIIAIILIFCIGAGILGYFQYKERVIPNHSVSPTASSSTTSPNPTSIPTLTPPPEVWETYTNTELGFSIKYPQMVYGTYGCSPNKPFYVPLKAFEDNINGIVYITEEYYYDDWDRESQTKTGPCEKNFYSIESLQETPVSGWRILIEDIKSESELNKFVKGNYGKGCFVGEKELWKQEGVYEIRIEGEDWGPETNLGTTTCPLNYTYKVLYAPEKNKVMSVDLGQECDFGTDHDSENYKCYDYEMIDSFRFK
ncbi:hypothetical protein KJ575_02210 [Patescibacteria group bacterium]|nr:hypothetical protein [Patescibacteria group bacterium]